MQFLLGFAVSFWLGLLIGLPHFGQQTKHVQLAFSQMLSIHVSCSLNAVKGGTGEGDSFRGLLRGILGMSYLRVLYTWDDCLKDVFWHLLLELLVVVSGCPLMAYLLQFKAKPSAQDLA